GQPLGKIMPGRCRVVARAGATRRGQQVDRGLCAHHRAHKETPRQPAGAYCSWEKNIGLLLVAVLARALLALLLALLTLLVAILGLVGGALALVLALRLLALVLALVLALGAILVLALVVLVLTVF